MKLKDFIEENRGDFDNKEMPMKSTQYFEKQLKQELHQKYIQHNFYASVWKIAASIVLLIGAYAFGRYQTNTASPDRIAFLKTENLMMKQTTMFSLLGNKSPIKRIEGINYIDDFSQPDESILNALINRMLYDQNVNVRFTAMRGLEKYKSVENVKDAFIKALGIEKDSRVQLSIINVLININKEEALIPMRLLLKKDNIDLAVKDYIEKHYHNNSREPHETY